MRLAWTIPLTLALAACDRTSDRPAPPEPTPSPLAPGEPAQTSIMRPDIAAPVADTAPIEPLDLTIGFPDGGFELGAAQTAMLAKFVASPQVKLDGPIRLGAHSDSAGTDAANLTASRKRGEAVRDWLVEHGIAEDRIALVAFGEQNPVRPNALPDGSSDEAGRAANRRVEIHVPVPNAPSAAVREPTLAEEIVEQTAPGEASAAPSDNSD